MTGPEVVDNARRHRFEILLDGQRAGLAAYRLYPDDNAPDTITFTHTEIDEDYGGRGLGGVLIRAALDTARQRGLAVIPLCPFVRGWLARHPDHVDLVPADRRAEFDLA